MYIIISFISLPKNNDIKFVTVVYFYANLEYQYTQLLKTHNTDKVGKLRRVPIGTKEKLNRTQNHKMRREPVT